MNNERNSTSGYQTTLQIMNAMMRLFMAVLVLVLLGSVGVIVATMKKDKAKRKAKADKKAKVAREAKAAANVAPTDTHVTPGSDAVEPPAPLYTPDNDFVPGYSFYEGMGFSDFDSVSYPTNDTLKLSKTCTADPTCVAFQANGTLKKGVRPQSEWKKWWTKPGWGLFVKRW